MISDEKTAEVQMPRIEQPRPYAHRHPQLERGSLAQRSAGRQRAEQPHPTRPESVRVPM